MSSRHVEHWLAAEAQGHDAEAEAAFEAIWRSMPRESGGADLEARIWRATRRTRIARRARALLRSLAAVAAVLGVSALVLYGATSLLVTLGGRMLSGLITWLMRGLVWVTLAFTEGLDTWAVLARIGAAVSDAVTTPRATTALVLIELVGALAFYVLNRVLARENKEIRQ